MGEGVEVMAGRPAEHPNQRRLTESCDLRHGRDGPFVELGRRGGPDAPQPLDRQRVQEIQLTVGRYHQQAVGFGDAAGHLGEELGPCDPHRHGQADAFEHVRAKSNGDLGGRARDPPQSADVEEGLVDRQPLDERRRPVEDLEQRLARLAVGVHPRANDDRLRAQPASL